MESVSPLSVLSQSPSPHNPNRMGTMRIETDPDWVEEPTAAVVARKRRMEARGKLGKEVLPEDNSQESSGKRHRTLSESFSSAPVPNAPSSSTEFSILPGIKKQSRYEPELPDEELAHWSREELSEWRKTARKVRNRESAAASRRKTRERITELEHEVEQLKSKYREALQRISVLSTSIPEVSNASAATDPILKTTDTPTPVVSPPSSVAPSSPEHTSTCVVSPPLSPREAWHHPHDEALLLDNSDVLYHHTHKYYHPPHPHIISISRPTAVCV